MPTNVYTCLPTYIPAYLLVCQPAYLPTGMFNYCVRRFSPTPDLPLPSVSKRELLAIYLIYAIIRVGCYKLV